MSLKVKEFVIRKQDVDSNSHFLTQNFITEKKGQSRIYRFDKLRQDSCISEGDYVVINNLDTSVTEQSCCSAIKTFIRTNWWLLLILVIMIGIAAGLVIYLI